MIEDNPYYMPDKETIISTDALLYFVWEREAIRIAKENKYKGVLTQDPILNRYKFTNIRRRDDKVSKWIINNIINIYNKDARPDLWFVLLIARLINWPPTLQYLIENNILLEEALTFNPTKFSKTIEDFRKSGQKAYSAAYMVYPTKKDIGVVKSLSIAKHIIKPCLEKYDEIDVALYVDNAVESFVQTLSSCFGINTFIAGQVAADLTYGDAALSAAKDIFTYAPIGPGSSKGLNYLCKRSAYAAWSQKDFNKTLIDINLEINDKLNIIDLTLHDVQNIMCEYSKYTRTVLKEGSPKALYNPTKEF